ncbi:MAG TPA: hypothetical protein VGL81_16540 [Polyangiaceae bacterium]|jgi:hypothetical protein
MRTLTISLLATAGLAAVVSSPDTALADTVPFQNLPVAPKMVKTAQPTAPEKIAAGEHTDGIFPAILPEARRKAAETEGYRYVQVFATEKEASAYSTDGTMISSASKEPSPTRTCLTSGGTLSPHLSLYFRTKPYVAPKPSPQTIAMLQKMHRWPPPPQKVSKLPAKDTVELIHMERLTQAADGATLETTEAFIDLQTMGTHAVSKSTTKLVKVATGPNSLGVYAAREEGEKGGSQFLVTNPELPQTASEEDRQAQVQQLTSTANRLVAQMPSGVSSETGCGYVRFTLSAKPGSGQMATVLATAFLPPGTDASDGGEEDMSRFESEDMSEEQLKAVREMVHRDNRSQRARTVAVNLSFSQLASETSPLLSVTFGWAGKDQQLRF